VGLVLPLEDLDMKPLLPLTLLALLLTAAAWGAMKINATRVYVNGLLLRDQAIVKDGVTYVPLRAVAESLGCTVDYDPKAGVFIWGGPQPSVPPPPEAPNPNLTPGLPTPGFPRDPRPVVPRAPMPGRWPQDFANLRGNHLICRPSPTSITAPVL